MSALTLFLYPFSAPIYKFCNFIICNIFQSITLLIAPAEIKYVPCVFLPTINITSGANKRAYYLLHKSTSQCFESNSIPEWLWHVKTIKKQHIFFSIDQN